MTNKTDNSCGKNNARRSLSFRRNKQRETNKNDEPCSNNMNGRSILVRVKNGNKNHQELVDSDAFLDNTCELDNNNNDNNTNNDNNNDDNDDDVTHSVNSLVSNSIKKPTTVTTTKAKKKLSKIRFFHKNKQKLSKHKIEKEVVEQQQKKNATWLPRCISVSPSKNRKISRLARPPNFILKKRKQKKLANNKTKNNKKKKEKKGKRRRDYLRIVNHDSCTYSLFTMFINIFSCSSLLSNDDDRQDPTAILEKGLSSLHDLDKNEERTEPEEYDDSWCNLAELFCLYHTEEKNQMDGSETSSDYDEDDDYDDDDDSTQMIEVPESITFLPLGSKASHKNKSNPKDDHWNLIPVASDSLSSISDSDSECSYESSDDRRP